MPTRLACAVSLVYAFLLKWTFVFLWFSGLSHILKPFGGRAKTPSHNCNLQTIVINSSISYHHIYSRPNLTWKSEVLFGFNWINQIYRLLFSLNCTDWLCYSKNGESRSLNGECKRLFLWVEVKLLWSDLSSTNVVWPVGGQTASTSVFIIRWMRSVSLLICGWGVSSLILLLKLTK